MTIRLFTVIVSIFFASSTLLAQTTEFSYQGHLKTNGSAANGNYDLEFRLFDSLTAGSQVGMTLTRSNVPVSDGIFSVNLDFGSVFPGASRYLEISAKVAGGGLHTLLEPRQRVNSAPYSIKSLLAESSANSLQLGGVAANQFVQTADPRLSDARDPLPGSANYVQNTISPQSSANFNISGSGTAGDTLSADILNAETQINMEGERVFVARPGTVVVGGQTSTVGSQNAILGFFAGRVNTGFSNTFIGHASGNDNVNGTENTFIGIGGGGGSVSGSRNTTLGAFARPGSSNLSFATAIGAQSVVNSNDTVVVGKAAGTYNGVTRPADVVQVPGTLSVTGGTDAGLVSGGYITAGVLVGDNVVIDNNEIMARSNAAASTLAINANGGNVNLIQGGTGNVGIGTSAPADKLDVNGDIRVGTSGTNGCLKGNGGATIIGTCSSDLRFKRNIAAFPNVLNKVVQLRPVTYFWRSAEFPEKHFGPEQTYGLVAQDVEEVLPDLVSVDAQGYKQIDYGKLPLLTIQAIKELNEKNKTLKEQVDEQKTQIAALKEIMCSKNRKARICRARSE